MQHTVELLPSGDLEFRTATGRALRIPMQCATSEVPWPEPENELATLWKRRALIAEAGIKILHKMLSHVEKRPDEPLAYPTQHVVEAMRTGSKINWTQREPVVSRTVIGEVLHPKPKTKPSLRAFRHEKLPDIDLSMIDFDI